MSHFFVKIFFFYIFFIYKVMELVGGWSVIDGAYPVYFFAK